MGYIFEDSLALPFNSLHAGKFCISFVLFFFVFVFFRTDFFEKNLSGIPSVSTSLDPNQAQHFVGPDLFA